MESSLENKIKKMFSEYQNDVIFDNLPLFFTLAYEIKENLKNYSFTYDVMKIPETDIHEVMNNVFAYYESIGIKCPFEDLLLSSHLKLRGLPYKNDYQYIENNLSRGMIYYNNGEYYVVLYLLGLMSDAFNIVHELSHYNNVPIGIRNQYSHLFTEAIASAEEFLFADFIEQRGMKEIASLWYQYRLDNFFKTANIALAIFNVLTSWGYIDDIGISPNYEISSDDFKICQKYFLKNNYDFHHICWYLMAYSLSPFLFFELERVDSKGALLKEWYNKINYNDISSIFSSMGLNDLGDEDRVKLKKSLIALIKSRKI